MSDPASPYHQGLQTRRKVLGDDYVDASLTSRTPFNDTFQTLITESAWGTLWSRPTIPLRERSMLTIALLAALGHYDEMVLHICATRNTGASQEDVKEALLHVAIYAGVPAANHAFKIAAQAYEALQTAEQEEQHA